MSLRFQFLPVLPASATANEALHPTEGRCRRRCFFTSSSPLFLSSRRGQLNMKYSNPKITWNAKLLLICFVAAQHFWTIIIYKMLYTSFDTRARCRRDWFHLMHSRLEFPHLLVADWAHSRLPQAKQNHPGDTSAYERITTKEYFSSSAHKVQSARG